MQPEDQGAGPAGNWVKENKAADPLGSGNPFLRKQLDFSTCWSSACWLLVPAFTPQRKWSLSLVVVPCDQRGWLLVLLWFGAWKSLESGKRTKPRGEMTSLSQLFQNLEFLHQRSLQQGVLSVLTRPPSLQPLPRVAQGREQSLLPQVRCVPAVQSFVRRAHLNWQDLDGLQERVFPCPSQFPEAPGVPGPEAISYRGQSFLALTGSQCLLFLHFSFY